MCFWLSERRKRLPIELLEVSIERLHLATERRYRLRVGDYAIPGSIGRIGRRWFTPYGEHAKRDEAIARLLNEQVEAIAGQRLTPERVERWISQGWAPDVPKPLLFIGMCTNAGYRPEPVGCTRCHCLDLVDGRARAWRR